MYAAMKSSRKLDFSVCSLCGSSHSHTSSPGEWKNVEAKKYILSLGIPANSQVCRPCRQDTTRALADSAYIPRWEKGKEASKTTCCVLNCTELAIARANLCSTNDLSQLDIDFPPLPIPTPTPLCRSHYHAVYDALQTRQKNCRTCGRRLRLGDMVPSTEALYLHWRRSCWVLSMWTQSDRNTMVLPPITEHGWTLQDTSLKIIWDTEQNMQKVRERVNILFGGCKCRTGCKSRVCGCRRKQKLCSEGCECTNCGNNASPVHNSDGFSDPDEAAVESSGETEDEAEFADFVLAEAMDKF